MQKVSSNRETAFSNIPSSRQYTYIQCNERLNAMCCDYSSTWLSEGQVAMVEVVATGRMEEGGLTEEGMGSVEEKEA